MRTRHISMRGLGGAASALALCAALAGQAAALPIRDDIGVDGAVDTENVYGGVGMMFSAAVGGVCTGQLINARTVLFAAHCVDDFDQAAYGSNSGGLPLAFGFNPDALPGLQAWFASGFATQEQLRTFNTLQVQTIFNGALPFPGGDIALATLDTPAAGLPTYGMLFSPVTESTRVEQVGYGVTGTGSTGGSVGIDFRRRAGENMVDALMGQNDFLAGAFDAPGADLFGITGFSLMYFTDFDRPDRDDEACFRRTAAESQIGQPGIQCDNFAFGVQLEPGGDVLLGSDEINWFGGGALEREAGTAGGDSGSALFASDLADFPLIIGVLSGGFTFTSPLPSGYGDVSYYQALFPYAGWIMENNPYVYASAAAGDGVWSDSGRWAQTLDPNYFIVGENGDVVNGAPAETGDIIDGLLQRDPRFGDIYGYDVSTDDGQPPAADGAGGIAATDNRGTAALGVTSEGYTPVDGGEAAAGADLPVFKKNTVGHVDPAELGLEIDAEAWAAMLAYAAQAGDSAPAFSPSLADGFVPNNDFGLFGGWQSPADGVARFYDVNLAAAGVTTVDMNVEVDSLTISGLQSGFVLPEAYIFSSLVAVNQTAGMARIDGLLGTREYLLLAGMLSGAGLISTEAVWNVAGAVRPGGPDGPGALTILGDYVQTEAGLLLIDWTAGDAGRLDVIGSVSLDGALGVNPEAGYLPRFGDTRRVLTWSGERVGEFADLMDLPGVLFFDATYGAGFVDLTIEAESFVGFTTYENAAQLAIAGRLDTQRSSQSSGALAPIYASVDLLPGPQLTAAFENLVPHEAFQFRSTVGAHGSAFSSALRSRLTERPAEGGAPAPAQAMFALMGSDAGRSMGGASLAAAARQADETGPQVTDAGNGIAVFFAGGVIDGSIRTSVASPRSGLEGGYAMAGIDYGPADGWRFGGMVGFASSETDQVLPAGGDANGRTESIQGGVYAQYALDGWLAQVSAALGDHSSRTRRSAAVGAGLLSTGTLEATTTHLSAMAGRQFVRDQFVLTPSAGIDYTRYEFDSATQTGSAAALEIESQGRHEAIARAGVDVGYRIIGQGLVIEPRAYVGYAATLTDLDAAVNGDFAAAPGGTLVFDTGAKRDANWLDLSVGIVTRFDNGIELSGNYQTREADSLNLRTNVLSAGVRYRF
jgi:hypothetical protein